MLMGHGGREFITPINWHVDLPKGGAWDTESEVHSRKKEKKRWNISFGSTVPFEVPVQEVCCKTNTHLVHTNCATF